jgi:hypothetical protein
MIKHPFTVRDATNPHYRELLGRVADAFTTTLHSRPIGQRPRMEGDEVILVDFGTTLRQLDWRDETGYFVSYRLHPMYAHLEEVHLAALAIEAKLSDLFGARGCDVWSQVENDVTTLFFRCGSHSIGD